MTTSDFSNITKENANGRTQFIDHLNFVKAKNKLVYYLWFSLYTTMHMVRN